MLYWGQIPISFLYLEIKYSNGWPPYVKVPIEGHNLPIKMLMIVDLPAPLGPKRTRISPGKMSKDTSFIAYTWAPDYFL